jgi:hypothetical protein
MNIEDIPDHWLTQYVNQPDTYLGKQNRLVAQKIMQLSHKHIIMLAESRGLTYMRVVVE